MSVEAMSLNKHRVITSDVVIILRVTSKQVGTCTRVFFSILVLILTCLYWYSAEMKKSCPSACAHIGIQGLVYSYSSSGTCTRTWNIVLTCQVL